MFNSYPYAVVSGYHSFVCRTAAEAMSICEQLAACGNPFKIVANIVAARGFIGWPLLNSEACLLEKYCG